MVMISAMITITAANRLVMKMTSFSLEYVWIVPHNNITDKKPVFFPYRSNILRSFIFLSPVLPE